MTHYIVGLGNPGEEYEKTRHNTGRIILEILHKKHNLPEFKEDTKVKALITKWEIDSSKVLLILPNNFMNNSGPVLKNLQTTTYKLQTKYLIVIYDDMDLPFGTFKISFNKSSGGHKGLESIIKALKSREFLRIRVGISPQTPGGKLKKPKGEKKVLDFIMSDFKEKELKVLKNLAKKIDEAMIMIIDEGKEKAMSLFNQ